MARARRHSDLASAIPWPSTQTCLSWGLRPGFAKRQWGNEIPTPDTGQPLALNVFFCFIQRGVCAAQVWTDRTELEAVGQSPGHWISLQHLS